MRERRSVKHLAKSRRFVRMPEDRPVGKLIGERIAALRLEKRLTLGALASATGLGSSFLSKLERGRTSISVDNLRGIAHALSVEIVSFFEREDSGSATVTRKGRGTLLKIGRTSVYGESLIARQSSALQATLYRTPPSQGRLTGFSHKGEEFVLVLRGRIRYWAGSAEFLLNPGDSVWHRSSEPHGWKNTGKSVAVSLHVNTPPVW